MIAVAIAVHLSSRSLPGLNSKGPFPNFVVVNVVVVSRSVRSRANFGLMVQNAFGNVAVIHKAYGFQDLRDGDDADAILDVGVLFRDKLECRAQKGISSSLAAYGISSCLKNLQM